MDDIFPGIDKCCLHQFELFSPFHYAVAIIISIGVCSFIKQLSSYWCFFYIWI